MILCVCGCLVEDGKEADVCDLLGRGLRYFDGVAKIDTMLREVGCKCNNDHNPGAVMSWP